MIKAIVTDIEGTTSSLSFVKDVLFPYAQKNLPDYVRANPNAPEVKAVGDNAIEKLQQWMHEDKKETSLKALQGLVWAQGYKSGELVADIYPDALAKLKQWKTEGFTLYIYSSGSVPAQKLLFGHTPAGDVNHLFSGYFDTAIGGKLEATSYKKIQSEIGVVPQEILFLSDNTKELDAAKAAGWKTVWLNRYGSTEKPPHTEVRSFAEIAYLSYRVMDVNTLPAYLAEHKKLAEFLGGAPQEWKVREVGDGNLNLVFIVKGTKQSLCVKQALPYVRLVGESWPLPLSRAHYEYLALVEQNANTPELVPALHLHDAELALTVMECLSPHIILRKGFIARKKYLDLAKHMGQFMARNLFYTSDFFLSAAQKKNKMAQFAGNTAMCKITEDLVFSEPYFNAPMNKWNSPALDETMQSLAKDRKLKLAVQEMKHAFLTRAEALAHGDLHSGSIMVTENQTRVIDPEFGFYAPIGFDVGMYIANLWLNYFSQDDAEYKQWLLQQINDTWNVFAEEFGKLWKARKTGDSYALALKINRPALKIILKNIWQDTVGFCGIEIIRRIVGLAHVEDLESIADKTKRGEKENAAIAAARIMITKRTKIEDVEALLKLL